MSKPLPPIAGKETFSCHDCGHEWYQGQTGNHDCITALKIQRDKLKEENLQLRRAIYPLEQLKPCFPAILFFEKASDIDELLAVIKTAKPGMKEYRLE